MTIFEALWKERASILQTLHQSIVLGLLTTWNRCRDRSLKPQEPDLVAGLAIESCHFMYQALNQILSKYRFTISLSSVFCHQTPKVTFHNMKKTSVELGDILFVHVHHKRHGGTIRNALLYQAKMSSKQPYKIGSSERDQLILYNEWPDFTYRNSGKLSGEQRKLNPKCPHTGAQYMLLDDRPPEDPGSGLLGLPGTYPIGSCMPDSLLYDHNHLAQELFDFLTFRSGRPFNDFQSSMHTTGWSKVIWELLDVGLRKAFNRKRSGYHSRRRLAGAPIDQLDGVSFAEASALHNAITAQEILGSKQTHFLFGGDDYPPDRRDNNNFFEDDGSGVSVILIETSGGTEEDLY